MSENKCYHHQLEIQYVQLVNWEIVAYYCEKCQPEEVFRTISIIEFQQLISQAKSLQLETMSRNINRLKQISSNFEQFLSNWSNAENSAFLILQENLLKLSGKVNQLQETKVTNLVFEWEPLLKVLLNLEVKQTSLILLFKGFINQFPKTVATDCLICLGMMLQIEDLPYSKSPILKSLFLYA